MPIVASRFHPPAFLHNGHVQTILPMLLLRRLSIVFERERLELEDGDFLDLDWARVGGDKLAILSHGLEGRSDDGYNRGMATALHAAGWDALAWNFRGCGKEMNRLPRFYHSGETGDLGAVIRFAATKYSRIALVGFSLGGNLTLKYLGEASPHASVIGAVAISAPIDLAASARVPDNRRGLFRKIRPIAVPSGPGGVAAASAIAPFLDQHRAGMSCRERNRRRRTRSIAGQFCGPVCGRPLDKRSWNRKNGRR